MACTGPTCPSRLRAPVAPGAYALDRGRARAAYTEALRDARRTFEAWDALDHRPYTGRTTGIPRGRPRSPEVTAEAVTAAFLAAEASGIRVLTLDTLTDWLQVGRRRAGDAMTRCKAAGLIAPPPGTLGRAGRGWRLTGLARGGAAPSRSGA